MKYRSEIDGLRAIAVVPVILFHAGFEILGGGFVGVDIFFVISGYLITSIILEEVESEKFNFAKFYERRARRILPALFLVMLFCIPFAWFWMLPSQLKDFSQSLVAVTFFLSNILFFLESGYFSESSEEKPLLHTWSLAVEEQYYLIFPLLIIIAWRFGRANTFRLVVFLSIVSFYLSEFHLRYFSSANFYLAPSRAWEIFSGSLSAFLVLRSGIRKSDIFSVIGITLILISMLMYNSDTRFPSIFTVVPVVGTVLILICADQGTVVASILSNRILVWIGLISYSAYLWHQPLFAFTRISFQGNPPAVLMGLMSLISILLAYLSWKFVEAPFRDRQRVSSVHILCFSLLGMLLFAFLGFLGHYKQGFSERMSYESEDLRLNAIAAQWDFSGYPAHDLIKDAGHGYYSIGEVSDDNSSIVFVGDSHALQYWYPLAEYVKSDEEKFSDKNIFLSGSFSVDDYESIDDFYLPTNTKRVVLSYFWSLRLNNSSVNTFIRCCGNGPGGVVGENYVALPDNELELRFLKIENFVNEMRNREIEVTLIMDNPFGEELDAKSLLDVQRGFGIRLTPNAGAYIELSLEEAKRRREPSHSKLLEIASSSGASVIDPFLFLCSNDYCEKFGSDFGYLRYKDYDHLSFEATLRDAGYIFEILE